MPNRPITATRKSKPLSNSLKPKVMRNWPVTVSSPTAARAKPIIIEAIVLNGDSLPMPTKLQKVSSCTEKNSAGPNCSAKLAMIGARKVMTMTAISAPTNEEVNGGGEGFAGPALLRQRIAVEGRRHRPWLARNVEQDRGDGAAEQRSPIDAGEHDDRGGRRHAEGQRQQNGDAVGRAKSRQDADQHAEQDADHHVDEVARHQHDAEAVHQGQRTRPLEAISSRYPLNPSSHIGAEAQ